MRNATKAEEGPDADRSGKECCAEKQKRGPWEGQSKVRLWLRGHWRRCLGGGVLLALGIGLWFVVDELLLLPTRRRDYSPGDLLVGMEPPGRSSVLYPDFANKTLLYSFHDCGCSGLYMESLIFVLSLSRFIPRIGAIAGRRCCPLPAAEQQELNRLIDYGEYVLRSKKAVVDYLIIDAPAYAFGRYHMRAFAKHSRDPRFVVGRSMWETDRFPPHWTNQLWRYTDEVWVPSVQLMGVLHEAIDSLQGTYGSTLSSNAISVPRVARVPECLLDSIWLAPQCLLEPVIAADSAPFRFFSMFRFESRKGPDILLRAFINEFLYEPNVFLHLHTWVVGRSASPEDDRRYLRNQLPEMFASWGYRNVPQPFLDRIVVVTDRSSAENVPCMMHQYDAFVLPTRGEGWCLPCMEAMSSGLPVITTNWSAMPDFVNDDRGYLISAKVVPVDPSFGLGNWAEASVSELGQIMRHVATHRREARAKGLRAQQYVRQHHRQEVCAFMMLEHLRKLEDVVWSGAQAN